MSTEVRETSREARTPKNRQNFDALTAGSFGIQFAVSIVIGALFGSWLDGYFDSDPWLLVAGVVFGSIAAFRDLARFAQKANLDEL